MRNVLENTRLQPAACLLIDRGPRRKIMWQKSPLTTRPYDVANCIEKIAKRVRLLGRILAHEG
jgi:hypothetical protein